MPACSVTTRILIRRPYRANRNRYFPAAFQKGSIARELFSASGRFEEARGHFEAALRLKPTYAAGRFNYAIALARVKRFDEAQRQVEVLLRTNLMAAEGHDLLGNISAMRGNVKAAVDHYREAVRIQPDYGRAYLDWGATLADSGDLAGALPYLQKAAASPEQAVRQEATQILRELGKGR